MYFIFLASAAATLNGWASWSVSYYDHITSQAYEVRTEVGSIKSPQDDPKYWFRETNSKSKSIRWTTSDDCKDAKYLLFSINNISVPEFSVPGSGKKSAAIQPPDTQSYSIKAPGTFNGKSNAIIDISASTQPQISLWYKKAALTLEKCWSKSKPNFIND